MHLPLLKKSFSSFALCLAATALAPLSVHAQTTWTGAASNSYGTAGNWSTAVVPGNAVDVLINTSTPNATVNTGNLDRRGTGTTTIDGTGNLTVNGRFLQGGSGAFNVLGGSLTVNGQYFMTGGDAQSGTNGPGTLNQSAGTVTANLSRSWHLSDNSIATSGSSYNFTGGTLTVTQSADTGVGENLRGVWLGKGGAAGETKVDGDHFNVAGGTATFTRTTGNEANIRISRNSELSVTAGTVTFASYSNFWVGDGANGSTNNRITINGGTLNITGSTSLYLGREDDGKLTINSGILNLAGTLFLGGNGTGAFDGIGTATMTGGSLFAANISALNANSTFTFSGGTITLPGDKTSIINQSWWSGPAFANYNSLSDTTTITAVPEPSVYGIAFAGLLGLLVLTRRRALRQDSL